MPDQNGKVLDRNGRMHDLERLAKMVKFLIKIKKMSDKN